MRAVVIVALLAIAGSAGISTNNQPPPLLSTHKSVFQTGTFSPELESHVTTPNSYAHYLQCDPRWANDEMGTKGNGERATICREGCAMTSVSMALAGLGAKINNEDVTPKNLNQWLLQNGGYYCAAGDCNNLNLTATERLTPKMNLIAEDAKPAFHDIHDGLSNAHVVYVAHVHKNSHFVLLTNVNSEKDQVFEIHDPMQSGKAYMAYSNITDIIRYKINIYPSYKQCDSRWGPVQMGQNGETICQVGCLMSSISMAMGGNHITIPPKAEESTPLSVDHWLQENKGFVPGGSSLIEDVMVNINPHHIVWNSTSDHRTNDLSFEEVIRRINGPQPQILIANVMAGQHFVLIVGYRADGDTLVVNDPGFDRNTYSHSRDVVGYRIFYMTPV